jgi:hypothetical protein
MKGEAVRERNPWAGKFEGFGIVEDFSAGIERDSRGDVPHRFSSGLGARAALIGFD